MAENTEHHPNFHDLEELMHGAKRARFLEMIGIYVCIPLLIWTVQQRGVLIMLLWLGAIYAASVMRKKYGYDFRADWNAKAVTLKALGPILLRFVLAAVGLAGLTLILLPDKFLQLPMQRPQVWVMVMIFYPLISVLPQEVLFRSFFFRRYVHLLPGKCCVVFFSSVAFGLAHIIFSNWPAVILSFIGSYLFGLNYQKHRSLALVFIEHSLYGCFLFTIGLGWYFFSGAQMGR